MEDATTDTGRDDGRRAFWRLALLNACVAVLGGVAMLLGGPLGIIGVPVITGFPLLHLLWSLPMIAVANRRVRTSARNGFFLATGLTLLLSSGCWVIVASSIRLN